MHEKLALRMQVKGVTQHKNRGYVCVLQNSKPPPLAPSIARCSFCDGTFASPCHPPLHRQLNAYAVHAAHAVCRQLKNKERRALAVRCLVLLMTSLLVRYGKVRGLSVSLSCVFCTACQSGELHSAITHLRWGTAQVV